MLIKIFSLMRKLLFRIECFSHLSLVCRKQVGIAESGVDAFMPHTISYS